MRNDIVSWFLENEPKLAHKMGECNHSHQQGVQSPYHLEGSVWTHTMMVMTEIQNNQLLASKRERIILLIIGMLHDIGKVSVQEAKYSEERGSYYAFHGHEGFSTWQSIRILHNMKTYFNLTETDIKIILTVISLHGVVCDSHLTEIDYYRLHFSEADKKGAIRKTVEIDSQYPQRKYAKKRSCDTKKNLIIMIGIPCSGKTTMINNLYHEKYEILSRDYCINEYCSMFYKLDTNNLNYTQMYHFIHSNDEILKKFNHYFDSVIMDYKRRFDNICIDMTMGSLKQRRKMINIFNEYKIHGCVMMPSLSEIMKRNERRLHKPISVDVYNSMMSKFIMPVHKEGFDTIDIHL